MAFVRTRGTTTALFEAYRDEEGRPRQRLLANLHGESDTLNALAKLAARRKALRTELDALRQDEVGADQASSKVVEHLQLAEQELARVSHIARQTLGFYRESTSPASVHIPTLIESVLALYANKLLTKQIKTQLAVRTALLSQG